MHKHDFMQSTGKRSSALQHPASTFPTYTYIHDTDHRAYTLANPREPDLITTTRTPGTRNPTSAELRASDAHMESLQCHSPRGLAVRSCSRPRDTALGDDSCSLNVSVQTDDVRSGGAFGLFSYSERGHFRWILSHKYIFVSMSVIL